MPGVIIILLIAIALLIAECVITDYHQRRMHALNPKYSMFIVLEGPDGVGKTTQRDRLVARLEKLGRRATALAEPTKGQWGMKIRDAIRTGERPSPEIETRWFIEDRREDIEQNISPALRSGSDVVLDRYYLSTVAYQGARRPETVDKLLAENRRFSPKADLTLILRVDPEIAMERIQARGKADAFEDLEYQHALADLYFDLYENKLTPDRDGSVVLIDAGLDPDEVEQQIWDAVSTTLMSGSDS